MVGREKKTVKTIKELKPFTANGHLYSFNLELPISRWREYKKLKTILQFAGKEESDLFEDFKTIYDNVNGNQLDRHKILTVCHNNMHGLQYSIDNYYDAIFHLAALFINREGEDPTKFDKSFNEVKISDWEKEGYSAQSFFALAASLVKHLQTSLLEGLNDFSPKKKKAETAANTSKKK